MNHFWISFRDLGTLEAGATVCHSVNRQLAELAFQGLLPHIKERFTFQEFESLSHLVQRLSNVDVRAQDPRRSPF
jgi:hypothetical protein